MGFWVAPVGTPPHFLNRFQISALYAAVCSSFSRRWNSSTKYQVERPMARLMVTVFHTASWTMSIPGFFRFLPRPLMSKADQPVADVHGRAVVEEVEGAVHVQVQCLGHPVGLRDMLG